MPYTNFPIHHLVRYNGTLYLAVYLVQWSQALVIMIDSVTGAEIHSGPDEIPIFRSHWDGINLNPANLIAHVCKHLQMFVIYCAF